MPDVQKIFPSVKENHLLRRITDSRFTSHASTLPLARLYPLALAALTALAFALRLPLLNRFGLHPDETIYSYWALHFLRDDPLFLTVWPDKPPIFLWLQAGAFHLFGVSEASARWLNIAASTLTVPVVAATGRALWGQHHSGRFAGLVAGAALALNPFALSFAPTAFTDPVLVLFGSLALLTAAHGRAFWSGLCLALAIMTKQQGVLYILLVVAVLSPPLKIKNYPFTIHHSLRFLLALALVILPILYWDSLRWAVAPSPWDLSTRNYATLALLPPAQWLDRAATWGEWLWYFTASGWVWVLLGMTMIAASIQTPRVLKTLGVLPTLSQHRTTLTLMLWPLAFLALHLITNVQPWDRYLLPLIPIFALLIGATFSQLRQKSSQFAVVLLVALSFSWIAPALAASQGQLSFGGDRGAWSGLSESLAWVQRESPSNTVIHHDRLGWHLRFYLYDELADGNMEARWFPSPVALVDDVTKRPAAQRQFWIAPDWSPQDDVVAHAQMRSVMLEPRAEFGSFTIYEFSTR